MVRRGVPYGINIVAETKDEEDIIKRFYDSGVKVNGIMFGSGNSSLQLTFADLID